MDDKIKKKLFWTKSPNLGKREFWGKNGRRHFSLLVVPYLHAKFQKISWTRFPGIALLTDWLTNSTEFIGPSLRGSKMFWVNWVHRAWIRAIFAHFTSFHKMGAKFWQLVPLIWNFHRWFIDDICTHHGFRDQGSLVIGSEIEQCMLTNFSAYYLPLKDVSETI